MALEHVDYHTLSINPMNLFSDDWGILTAGTEAAGFNGMTVAWGHLGAIWDGKRPGSSSRCLPTAVCYVRPQRHTKKFIDTQDHFSISFLPAGNKKALGVMGSVSGRDGEAEKFAKAGLTPAFDETTGTAYVAEAELVFICRKLYHQGLREEGFDDAEPLENNYPDRDLHTMYIGEIVDVLKAE